MKICIYAHSFPPIIGGAQTYQLNLAHGLSKLGHTVLVVTGNVPNELKPKIQEYQTNIYGLVRIPGFREFSKLGTPPKSVLLDSYKAISSFDPDIIYSHGYAPCLAISLIRKALRGKHVFSYHSTPETEVKKVAGIWKGELDLELAFARFVMQNCDFDAYVACSQRYMDFAKNTLGLSSSKKAEVIYYGVDLEKFSCKLEVDRAIFGQKESDFVILCPVRLIERKGILDILEALAILKKSGALGNRKIKMLIPSSRLQTNKEYEVKVYDKVKELELEDNVIITMDRFTIKDMPNLYAASDVVVLPSYSEGLGIVLLEAMAMKKPVIATDIAGVTEVVKNNETGFVVPIKNPESLAMAITKVYLDRLLIENLTGNGYIFIQKNFDLSKQLKAIENLFFSL